MKHRLDLAALGLLRRALAFAADQAKTAFAKAKVAARRVQRRIGLGQRAAFVQRHDLLEAQRRIGSLRRETDR